MHYLYVAAHYLGISYEEINIYICIALVTIGPALIIGLCLRIRHLKKRLNQQGYWKQFEHDLMTTPGHHVPDRILRKLREG